MNFSTQICLVSDQPLPNLLPALSPALACRRAVLLATPQMTSRADSLADALARHGIEVIRTTTQSENLEVFRRQVTELASTYPDAMLNATGGLKTMSIMAFDVFRSASRPVFYVERDNRLIWLSPSDRPASQLPGVLGLQDYFAAFGQVISAAERHPLDGDGGMGMLARPSALPPPGPGRAGQQFESLVFRAMRTALDEVGSKPTEVAWGVKVSGTSTDEFDVVAVRDNVLYLIECKHAGGAGLNGFLNKLENLRRQRGITARAALVTTASVPTNGGHAQRASDNGILLLSRRDLPKLVERLVAWLSR